MEAPSEVELRVASSLRSVSVSNRGNATKFTHASSFLSIWKIVNVGEILNVYVYGFGESYMEATGYGRSRVLVIEDERSMAELLRKGLEDQYYSVTVTYNGSEGLELAAKSDFSAIVLDVILPGIDGYAVARKLRSIGNQTPIIMLTARDALDEVVWGLDAGAEDYLTKPFSFVELLARLRALVRRNAKPLPSVLTVSDLVLDTKLQEVSRGGTIVPLTRTEYLLLEVLMQSTGHVVLRPEIIKKVWGATDSIELSSLDVYVKALRAKIDADPAKKLIYTVRGFGYKLMENGRA
jgi:DNA-binding response OmpR family regulator